jgi:predicted Zn-dependent protease
VRRDGYGGALDLLRRASELTPDNARYAYVYAVAVNSAGAPGQAMAVLDEAHRQHRTDRGRVDGDGCDRATPGIFAQRCGRLRSW